MTSSGQVAPLDVDEQEDPPVRLEPPPEFLEETGLAHAPLAGHQQVVPFPNPCPEQAQFVLAVEEVVAADPAAGGGSHGVSGETVSHITILLNVFVDNIIVDHETFLPWPTSGLHPHR